MKKIVRAIGDPTLPVTSPYLPPVGCPKLTSFIAPFEFHSAQLSLLSTFLFLLFVQIFLPVFMPEHGHKDPKHSSSATQNVSSSWSNPMILAMIFFSKWTKYKKMAHHGVYYIHIAPKEMFEQGHLIGQKISTQQTQKSALSKSPSNFLFVSQIWKHGLLYKARYSLLDSSSRFSAAASGQPQASRQTQLWRGWAERGEAKCDRLPRSQCRL